MACHQCGQHYHGEAVKRSNRVDLRLTHERRGPDRDCDAWPRSRSVESLNSQFGDRVLRHLHLDESWKRRVLAALQEEGPKPADQSRDVGLRHAIENLRKQHIWGDIADDDYRRERTALERQIKLFTSSVNPANLPNLEKAAGYLKDLPRLWSHPGVTHEQRESLISIEPMPAYVPLFATIVIDKGVGYRAFKPPPSPPQSIVGLNRSMQHGKSTVN